MTKPPSNIAVKNISWMKPNTFIILSPGFPKDEADTTCLPFLQHFIGQLNEQFPSIEIIVFAFDYPFRAKEYLWKNNTVIPFNGWKKKNWGKLLKWRNIWRRLKHYRRNAGVMGLLSLWCGECAYLGARFSRAHHIPHFCWLLGQDARPGNKYVKRIRPRGENLIAISDFIRKEFQEHYGVRPQHVIPAGIQTQKRVPDKKRDIDLLGAGSLITLKRYDWLVEIVYEVCKYFPGIQVVIAGKGPEMDHLKQLTATFHLEKNITWAGELNHGEVLELMGRTKIFLHPSAYEGLGAVCLEALYAGCHVISFLQSMDNNFSQWHVVDSKEDMTAKTLSLLRDRLLSFESVTTFTVQESVRKIMGLYV
jgi:glycosyltransferase involved in cell wall biosynthesis